MQRTSASRRITWSPGWRLRAVLLATTVGSVGGLVGVSSLNRPMLNAGVFSLLGGAVAAVVAILAIVIVRLCLRPIRPDQPAAARRGAAPAWMSDPHGAPAVVDPSPAGDASATCGRQRESST